MLASYWGSLFFPKARTSNSFYHFLPSPTPTSAKAHERSLGERVQLMGTYEFHLSSGWYFFGRTGCNFLRSLVLFLNEETYL